jgi:outer membrane receptor protein involved in Fe transport
MKSFVYIIAFMACLVKPCLAQNPTVINNNGILLGNVKDSLSNIAIDLANVSLLRLDLKAVSATLTDKSGNFQFINIPFGSYYLVIDLVGYKQLKTPAIVLSINSAKIDLGSLLINTSVNELKEVNITAQKQIIKIESDKITYSVENDISNRGVSALDALNKAPLIGLAGADKITLKGSSNYKVFVNGKPSSLYTNKLVEVLRSMPAEQIKDIEIITNPSAKYEAEGTGGIINIITHKKIANGYSGSIFGGINSIGDFSDGIQGSATAGKWNVNLQFSNGKYHRPSNNIQVEQENYTDKGTSYLKQNQDNVFKSDFLSGSLDLNYSIDTLNTLSASILLYKGKNSTKGLIQSDFANENLMLGNAFERDFYRKTSYLTTEVNAGYQHNFKQAKKYISFSYRLNYDEPEIFYQTVQLPIFNTSKSAEKNYNNEVNKESAIQIDYSQPILSKGLLEVGTKLIYRDLISDYEDYVGSTISDLLLNPAASGKLKYIQNVYSGYSLYSLKLQKFSFRVGARVEHTDLKGDLNNKENEIKQSYYSFIPSLSSSFTFKNKTILRVSYARRIQRPSLFYINPSINQLNSQSISYGNPNLKPEYIDSYELGYNLNIKKAQLNFLFFYQKTNNSIESERFLLKDSILVSTFNNFGVQDNLGLNVYASANVFEKLSLSGNITPGYYNARINNSNSSQFLNGFSLKVGASASYRFTKSFSIMASTNYNSPIVRFQTRSYHYFLGNIGVSKNILKDKANISLNFNQPFLKTSFYRTAYSNNDFYQLSTNRYPERFIRLNFMYKFGKTDGASKSVRKVRIDDLKS